MRGSLVNPAAVARLLRSAGLDVRYAHERRSVPGIRVRGYLNFTDAAEVLVTGMPEDTSDDQDRALAVLSDITMVLGRSGYRTSFSRRSPGERGLWVYAS